MKLAARLGRRTAVIALGGLSLGLGGCGVDEAPQGLKKTPAGDGATIRFDVYHKPLPEIPMPNDAAMWPDPTSRTGVRVNASLGAPTNIEQDARRKFNQLEGFGTYSGITIAFDKTTKNDARPALDLENIQKRHVGDDYEFENDAIYVVNLATGIPVPLDLGEGAFQYIIREKQKYWRNDTRRYGMNLLYETADETVDPLTGKFDPARTEDGTPTGKPIYNPAWDTDFDGVLDRPNLADYTACPNQAQVELGEVRDADRDRCLADNLMTWYERETDTLIMRPLIPMEEKSQYAVVVTDRTLDADGNPVKSPFDFVYHPAQEPGMKMLQSHLENPDLASYYGDIGGKGLDNVAFAWTFTTEPVVEDLRLLRDGLYGTGPFARLAKQFPAEAEMQRAVGLTDLESLEPGEKEPANWQDDPACAGKTDDYYIVKFENIKTQLRLVASQSFGLEGPELDGLIASFDHISHIAVGFFKTPFFIEGGPQNTDSHAAFDLDYRTGEGKVYTDTVQFMLAIPKESKRQAQPFPVAYYGHGYTSSTFEALGFAGSLAQQGIATVSMNATWHGVEVGDAEKDVVRALLGGVCHGPFGSALLAGRYRDLDGDGQASNNSGGDYWTSYVFHTRDVVRQSSIDLLQMFRIFKTYDGEQKANQDYNQDGKADLAGDFDHDGTPDIGGKNPKFHAWGQSLGGILAPFVAALDPDVITAAPGSGAAGLLDVGARTFQGGAFEGIYLRNFGPIIVGVPAKEFYDADRESETSCKEDEISLRFVVIDVNDDREVEFQCLNVSEATDGAGLPDGGTVVAYNIDNGERRCARLTGDQSPKGRGRFRIGLPASVGDRLQLNFYAKPDAVDTYDPDSGCNVEAGLKPVAELFEWGDGLVEEGATDPNSDSETPVCTEPRGCSRYQNRYYPAGTQLVSLVEGFGYIRQTPSLRRFMGLAATAVDPGDPVNFLPHFALKPIVDHKGEPHPPTALLNFVTVGDMNVPLNAGIAMGRVAGAVPFLRPDAANRYPALADYVTPQSLYSALGAKTPNRVLVDNHVLEGINRLERNAPTDLTSCTPNEVALTAADTYCHPECTADDDSKCLRGQHCVDDRCVARPVSEDSCARILYDVDVLDDGVAAYRQPQAQVPLRLGRIATPASPTTIDDVWMPRLLGSPGAKDADAWSADQRVVAQLMAYVEPTGVHGFNPADTCQAWVVGRYMINLIGRFFATEGADLYYLSHPASHQCLGRDLDAGSCSFVRDVTKDQ